MRCGTWGTKKCGLDKENDLYLYHAWTHLCTSAQKRSSLQRQVSWCKATKAFFECMLNASFFKGPVISIEGLFALQAPNEAFDAVGEPDLLVTEMTLVFVVYAIIYSQK